MKPSGPMLALVVCVGALCLAWPAAGGFLLLEDFEGEAGELHGKHGWRSIGGAFAVADPADSANAVGVFLKAGEGEGFAWLPLGACVIDEMATGTLFFRVRFLSTAAPDFAVGLTDKDTPGAFADFSLHTTISGSGAGNWYAKGKSVKTETAATGDTWYSVWYVVDNAADRFEVHVLGGALGQQALLCAGTQTSFRFRNPTPSALRTLLIAVGSKHGRAVGYVDDIHIDGEGRNLTNPVPRKTERSTMAFPADSKYLLLGSEVVDVAEGVRLALGQVRKDECNPLFVEDRPWEVRFDNLYANVVFDEDQGIYKCWYSPFIIEETTEKTPEADRESIPFRQALAKHTRREMGLCYATSEDGTAWEKPALGIVDFEGGGANNLVMRQVHGAGVFRDTRDPDPGRRYKMLFHAEGMSVAASPDGLHWSPPVPCPEIAAAGDTHNNVLWDERSRTYVGITRLWADGQRIVGRTESPEFRTWTKATEVLRGLDPRLQTYAMPVFRYANVYLGLVMIFDTETDLVDCELAWSPDTVQWARVCPGTPLISRGPKGSCDSGCVYAAAYPVVRDDEIRLYYAGSDGPHTDWRKGSLCLARLRPDGFVGMEPAGPSSIGTVITQPVRCLGADLQVSADAAGGSLRVAVLAVDGLQLEDCEPIRADVTDGVVRWRGGRTLAALKGKPVRLQFELKSARLYAFGFADSTQAQSTGVEIGHTKQLFFDDTIVAGMEGVRKVVNQPQRHPGNPLIVPGHPWEGRASVSPTVLYVPDAGQFYMYYWTHGGMEGHIYTCLARSADGLHWEKPVLGLHEGPDGTKQNNIVLRGEGNTARTRYVVLNPNAESADEAFVAMYIDNVPNLTEFIATSPDGIHWETVHRIGDLRNVTGSPPTPNPPFFLVEQKWLVGELDHRYRAIWRTESRDLRTWGGGTWAVRRDAEDPPDLEFYHAVSHFMGSQTYHGFHLGYYFPYHTDPEGEKKTDGVRMAGTIDTALMVSRDTIDWLRIGRGKPFLPLGAPGTWEGGMVFGAPETVVGDEIRFYYSGFEKEHSAEENAGGVGLATLRADGFVSIEPEAGEGTLTTKPFELAGSRLEVNVDASEGQLRVSVLRGDGQPIAGLGAEEGRPLTADGLRQNVEWTAGKALTSRRGTTVRLRFHLAGRAKLYAFQIEP